MPPLLEAREVRIDQLDPLLHRAAVLLDVAAGYKVLLGGQVLEHTAALEHLDETEPGDVMGAHAVDAPLAELDRALGDFAALAVQHAGNGFQRRRLAGAVGAQQGRDRAFADADRHALEDEDDAVVDDLDVVDRQHWSPVTKPWVCVVLSEAKDLMAPEQARWWQSP